MRLFLIIYYLFVRLSCANVKIILVKKNCLMRTSCRRVYRHKVTRNVRRHTLLNVSWTVVNCSPAVGIKNLVNSAIRWTRVPTNSWQCSEFLKREGFPVFIKVSCTQLVFFGRHPHGMHNYLPRERNIFKSIYFFSI